MALGIEEFMQMSPIFIAVFMLMTSMFNGDVKAFIWLICITAGLVLVVGVISKVFPDNGCTNNPPNVVMDLFWKYPNLSVSTFFIVFTLMYLVLPMLETKDWNYYVIIGFLGIFAVDTLFKLRYCTTGLGISSGACIGALLGATSYFMIKYAGGDKLLYFNTVSSNNVYCSRPKKQQFKCYVYKNGEIISTL
jgi:hypothetical protein